MRPLRAALVALGRRGRLVLVAGLVAGTALPGPAQALRPLIPAGVAALLFLATLRVGVGGLTIGRHGWAAEAGRTLVMQTVLPLAGLGGLAAAGVADTTLALGVVLTLAASPLVGSPGLALLAGADPAPALKAMAVGTALFPLTVLPLLALLPVLGSAVEVAATGMRVLVLVVIAGGSALAVRARWPALGGAEAGAVIDGAVAALLAVMVVALMAAVGPALGARPGQLVTTLAVALTLCFGGQLAALAIYRSLGGASGASGATALAVAAGNRNLALVFAALPEEVRANLLLYVGLYQIPMYLTPFLMAAPFARAGRSAEGPR